MSYRKHLKITTPVGIAVFPRLNEPDTQFDKDGLYNVILRLPSDIAKETISKITGVFKENLKNIKEEKGKKVKEAPLPIKNVEDEDGSPTGEVDIKFKLRAIGQKDGQKWEQRPALFDSSGKPLSETIGGGSTIKIGAEVVPYYTSTVGAGVTLRLKAVQVIKLVEFSSVGFESWGFSEEEGFVSKGKEEPKESKEVSSDQDEEDSDFDF